MEHLVVGVLVLTRLGMLLMAMPAVGVGVPKRIKALLALMMTALLLPALADRPSLQNVPEMDHLASLAIAVAREALVGLLIGATI
ncbi:MAG: flagellar biosynthetic protein FliR, partial [Rhodopirellula sp. JB053]